MKYRNPKTQAISIRTNQPRLSTMDTTKRHSADKLALDSMLEDEQAGLDTMWDYLTEREKDD